MSVTWGDPEGHTAAFVLALEEFHREHPDESRPFEQLDREQQAAILARQVELYQVVRNRSTVSA